MDDAQDHISKGPGEPDRNPPPVEGDGPKVHTDEDEGHPAGEGERTDRDIGGPTAPENPPDEDAMGGAPGRSPGPDFEPHADE